VQERIESKSVEIARLTKQWEEERTKVESRNKMREQLDAARIELEKAKRQADYET
jgi:hypothetical protein